MDSQRRSVTQLLNDWRSGKKECLNELIPLVEQELRQIAHRYMRMERRGHTLQTTALVNETYLKLVGQEEMEWQNRAHFIAISARAMRQILIDYARRFSAEKHGGPITHFPLDGVLIFSREKSAALIALDDALSELAKRDPRKVQVVELRYFGGLTIEETAEVLCVNRKTVVRDWNFAKAWLKRELGAKERPDG